MSKKIFISHAIKDKEIADAFVDLILQGALSVPINEIFCVSTDGTKIKSGDDWRNSIKSNILNAKINFLLISPNYKESEVCMNEMGAAWMATTRVIPLIIDPINYKTVGIIQEPSQIEKLIDESSLDRIKDIVQEELKIKSALMRSDRWTPKKKEFQLRVKKHLKDNPFETPMDRNTFKQLEQDKTVLEETINNLIEEKSELESLIEELKTVKDKTVVKTILKKRKITSQFDEFIALCNTVKKLLREQSAIMNGLIFKSYSRKNITIGWERNIDEFNIAHANGYIDEESEINWDAKEMMEICAALDDVSHFIDSDLDDNFLNLYEGEFDAPFKINNMKFWEKVFDASIVFN